MCTICILKAFWGRCNRLTGERNLISLQIIKYMKDKFA